MLAIESLFFVLFLALNFSSYKTAVKWWSHITPKRSGKLFRTWSFWIPFFFFNNFIGTEGAWRLPTFFRESDPRKTPSFALFPCCVTTDTKSNKKRQRNSPAPGKFHQSSSQLKLAIVQDLTLKSGWSPLMKTGFHQSHRDIMQMHEAYKKD